MRNLNWLPFTFISSTSENGPDDFAARYKWSNSSGRGNRKEIENKMDHISNSS